MPRRASERDGSRQRATSLRGGRQGHWPEAARHHPDACDILEEGREEVVIGLVTHPAVLGEGGLGVSLRVPAGCVVEEGGDVSDLSDEEGGQGWEAPNFQNAFREGGAPCHVRVDDPEEWLQDALGDLGAGGAGRDEVCPSL